ncbi:MAG TPA: tetratricopeptide repeat protein [Kiritimatiellia bacterium]|nr:tetratricopeptide repeat protein [Kiritimatiellia bacterium]
MNGWRRSWILGVLLALAVLAAYGPAYHAGFIWDDDDYVTRNETLREPGGLARIWFEPGATPQYYPLTFTSFWLEYRLWELRPAGYHAVNVLLHAANAILVWRLLALLGLPCAWLVGLLFGLHPVHVESVAWITERKNTLSGFFYLLAMWTWFRARPPERDPSSLRFRPLAYGVTLLLFVAALSSKTVTCSWPAAVLLVVWWKRGRLDGSAWMSMLPFFALGLLGAAATVHMESTHVRAVGPEWALGGLARLLIALRGLWFYALKLVWPVDLVFIYPRVVPNPGEFADWWPFGLTLLLAGGMLARRRQLGRGPFAALCFFAGTLFPALGFINVYPMRYTFVADHYVYLASLGLLTLAGAGIALLLERNRIPARVAAPTLALAVLALGFGTWRQTLMYRDLETLWTATLSRNPTAWIAHNNLGLLRHAAGRVEEAVTHYRAAWNLNPTAPEVLTNLGNAEAEKQNWAEAERWHRAALATRSDFPPGWYNLGNCLMEQGRLEEAAESYAQALRHKPRYPEALSNLGKTRARQGRLNEALRHYQRSLELEPDRASTWSNVAYLYLLMNRPADALSAADRALQLDPAWGPALHNRALALQRQGRPAEAGPAFEAAVAATPESLQLQKDAGVFWIQSGNMTSAEMHYRRAIERYPEIEFRYGLGIALASMKRREEALLCFRRIIEQSPDHVSALNAAAWIVATDASVDPALAPKAVEWARRAVASGSARDASLLSTLAAAHAAAGDFASAVAAAQEAVQIAEGDANATRLAELRNRLGLYQSGQPYRE